MAFIAVVIDNFVIIVKGEDVVAGIRTPEDIDTMRQGLPDAYKELLENCDILEQHYKDMMVSNGLASDVPCTISDEMI